MSDEELIEKAAKELDGNFNPDKHPIMAAMFRDYAATALAVFREHTAPTDDDRDGLFDTIDRAFHDSWTDAEEYAHASAHICQAIQAKYRLFRRGAPAEPAVTPDERCCEHDKCPGGSLCCCPDVPLREVERARERLMSEYTPTTKEVRGFYVKGEGGLFADEEFDRWLAEYTRQVKAEAWDEGHKTRWRRDPDDGCTCGAWAEIECGCGNYGTGELLSLNDNPYRGAPEQEGKGQ